MLASLLGSMYVELREVVRREDFTDLHHLFGDLADTQRGTEASVTQLAEAQSRTEAKIEQLAEAQSRTEALFHNSSRIDLMNKQYGGLSASMGYTLENEAYRFLPTLLKDDFDLAVEGTLSRNYLSDVKGNDMEIIILGDGTRKGENLLIIGECKSQLSKNNVDSFLKRRLRKLDTGNRKIFPSWLPTWSVRKTWSSTPAARESPFISPTSFTHPTDRPGPPCPGAGIPARANPVDHHLLNKRLVKCSTTYHTRA